MPVMAPLIHILSAGTSIVWRFRILGMRSMVSHQCWDRAAGITHKHAPIGEASLKYYCQSFASEQLLLGPEKSHLHAIAEIILHVATKKLEHSSDTNPKDARGACLGSAQLAEITPSVPDHGHACVGKHPVVPVMQGRHCHRQQLQARCHRS